VEQVKDALKRYVTLKHMRYNKYNILKNGTHQVWVPVFFLLSKLEKKKNLEWQKM
jgi:hypothetical protein